MISISKLETINTSQQWSRSGARVDIGSDVVLFEDECDADDAVIAINAIDDVVEIINAAKRWRTDQSEAAKADLIALIDKVQP